MFAITVPISPMRAASTVPAKPNQTCAFTPEALADPPSLPPCRVLTPEVLADPPSLLPRLELSRPTCSFSPVQKSCKAVPSDAPEINSSQVLAKKATMTKMSCLSTHAMGVGPVYVPSAQLLTAQKLARNATTVTPIAVMRPTYWKRPKTNSLPSLIPA